MEIEREQDPRSQRNNHVLMFYSPPFLKISNLLNSKTFRSQVKGLKQLPLYFEQAYLHSSLYIISPSFFYSVTSRCQLTRLSPSAATVQHNSLIGEGHLLVSTGGAVEGKQVASSELYSLKRCSWKQLPSMLHAAQNHSSVLLKQSILYCFTKELQVLKLNGSRQFESLQCSTLHTFSMDHLKIIPQNQEFLLLGHPETLYGTKLYKFTEEGELLKKQRSTIFSERKFELRIFKGKIYGLSQKVLSVWSSKDSKFVRLNK